MNDFGKLLVIAGLLMAGVGVLLWSGVGRGWLGRLPGDIHYTRGNFSFSFPIVTCLLISVGTVALDAVVPEISRPLLNFEPTPPVRSLCPVNNNLPSVTVIIAARPDLADIKAVASARALNYPADRIETLVARGKQPSVQRNAALREARGDLIYFLDDDSVTPPDALRRAVAHFQDAKVAIVGGPNLCPKDAPEMEQVFALVLASWALGPSRARYTPVGELRESGEKELILCNMVARREIMLKYGGFNEALYPNEENALMDDIQKGGGKLLYDPGFYLYRRPRRTLKSFVRMLLNYGRGRAEQFRVHPTPGSMLNFVPPLFCLYLVLLALALVREGLNAPVRLALIPLGFYLLALVLQTAALVPLGGLWRSLCALPLIFLTHIIYGIGVWRGLFTKLKPPGEPSHTPVTIERVV